MGPSIGKLALAWKISLIGPDDPLRGPNPYIFPRGSKALLEPEGFWGEVEEPAGDRPLGLTPAQLASFQETGFLQANILDLSPWGYNTLERHPDAPAARAVYSRWRLDVDARLEERGMPALEHLEMAS